MSKILTAEEFIADMYQKVCDDPEEVQKVNHFLKYQPALAMSAYSNYVNEELKRRLAELETTIVAQNEATAFEDPKVRSRHGHD